MDWVLCTSCAAHDCQNAIKWALGSACQDTQLMKDLHNVVESLINTSDALQRAVPQFVLKHVREFTSVPPIQDAEAWWQAMGVEAL